MRTRIKNQKQIKKALEIIMQGDYPVWWDGFSNVVLGGETADWTDNTYLKEIETMEHFNYRAGAIAAESLIYHQDDE
tara:strand:- start:218 stop:448 length:231 start_codon:yes stop_codon:yes gene_type:complete